MFGRPCHLMY